MPPAKRMLLDYRSAMDIRNRGCVGRIYVFSDATRSHAITDESKAYQANYYAVEYKLKIIAGQPRKYHNGCWVGLDLNPVLNEYPGAKVFPRCQVISKPAPWHHRIGGSGYFCTGYLGSDEFIMADYIVHIAKLLNFDEPFDSVEHDPGLNPAAYKYYMKHFKGKPVTPGLVYPGVSESVLSGDRFPGGPRVPRETKSRMNIRRRRW